MEEIIMQVPHPDYHEFRHKVLEESGWTATQFYNRVSGRTKTTKFELRALRSILDEMYGNNEKEHYPS